MQTLYCYMYKITTSAISIIYFAKQSKLLTLMTGWFPGGGIFGGGCGPL